MWVDCAQTIDTILSLKVHTIGRAYVITLTYGESLLWPLITFASEIRFWSLKSQYVWLVVANQMRQLPNPSNSQNCLWDWKCPYSSNVPYTRILHSSRYSGNLTGMVLLVPILMNQGIFMLVAGFFRLRKDLPKAVWRYPMSYISFHTYALQVLLIPNT